MTSTGNNESLEMEIKSHSRSVIANSYSMSVGELLAMYRDKELDPHPAFQRFFRWSAEKKSRFIESLLLDIPIPPIFVAEKENSKWELIDGLQRLSTIFEVMGELRNEHDEKMPSLTLCRTSFLPSLEGLTWKSDDQSKAIPESAQIKIKRARLDINIVKFGSDENVKYEIFGRLNSGEAATSQEVRNCLLLMSDPTLFEFVQRLVKNEDFRSTLSITDRALEESFDMELVVRLIVFATRTIEDLKHMNELGSYLDKEIIAIAKEGMAIRHKVEEAFDACFDFLGRTTAENSFRKYSREKSKYEGPMLIPLFECIAVGLVRHCLKGNSLPSTDRFESKQKTVWDEMNLEKLVIAPGRRSTDRIPLSVQFGEDWVGKCH